MATIIKTIDTLKDSLGGIQQTMQWIRWKPFVQQAEMIFVLPALGRTFYNELAALNYGTATDKQKALLDWLYLAIAEYSDLMGGIRLIMSQSDAGKQVASMQNQQAPGKWMYVVNQKESLAKGDTALENAIQYLESEKASFPAWVASPEYSLSYDLFLSSATELTKYFPPAKNSRRLFLQLREYVRTSQEFWAPAVVGEDLWEAWTAKLEAATAPTVKEKNAWKLLRYALAYHAVGESVTFLNINEDWRLISETDGIVNEGILDKDRRAEIQTECLKKSEEYHNRLLRYLNKNASVTVFPEFFSSSLYKPDVAPNPTRFPNNPDNKFFVL